MYQRVLPKTSSNDLLSCYDIMTHMPPPVKLEMEEFYGSFQGIEPPGQSNNFKSIQHVVSNHMKPNTGAVVTSDTTKHSVALLRDKQGIYWIMDSLTGTTSKYPNTVDAILATEAKCFFRGRYDITIVKIAEQRQRKAQKRIFTDNKHI